MATLSSELKQIAKKNGFFPAERAKGSHRWWRDNYGNRIMIGNNAKNGNRSKQKFLRDLEKIVKNRSVPCNS